MEADTVETTCSSSCSAEFIYPTVAFILHMTSFLYRLHHHINPSDFIMTSSWTLNLTVAFSVCLGVKGQQRVACFIYCFYEWWPTRVRVSTAAAQGKAPWMYVTMMMTDQMLELPPLLNGEVPMMHHMINGDASQQVNLRSTPLPPPDGAAVLRWLMWSVFAGDPGPGEPRRDVHHPQRGRDAAVHPRSVLNQHISV